MDQSSFSLLYKVSYLLVLVPTLLVIVSAVLSAKQMGGSLGEGLKKIAAGTVIHTIMILTFVFQELGFRGIVHDFQMQLFFLSSGLLGAALLITGYIQIYRISRKLKLFTV